MDGDTESKADRVARLKKSHEEFKKKNPHVYPREGTRAKHSRSRSRSSQGPGWAQALVNSLGRVERQLFDLRAYLVRLENRSQRSYRCESCGDDLSASGLDSNGRELEEGDSEYLENLRFDLENSGG